LRHEKDLTQEALAARARHVGSIERACVPACVTVLEGLAQAFSVDPCDLIKRCARPAFAISFLRKSSQLRGRQCPTALTGCSWTEPALLRQAQAVSASGFAGQRIGR
jgi:hypothetical protein